MSRLVAPQDGKGRYRPDLTAVRVSLYCSSVKPAQTGNRAQNAVPAALPQASAVRGSPFPR
jgi:hypothetical protein